MFNSLKAKLMLSMLIVVSIVIFTISFAIVKNQKEAAEQQSKSELESLTKLIATNTLSTVIFNDTASAQQTLLGLKNRPDILSAVVFDKNSQLFAQYQRDPKKNNNLDFALINSIIASGQTYLTKNEQGLHSYMPITSENEMIGVVYLANDLSSLNANLAEFYRIVTTIGLIALFASILLIIWLQIRFTKPLEQLLSIIQNIIETEDYGQRAPSSDITEFDHLAARFNTMLGEVEQRGKQLRTINTELEQRVEDRTIELESALTLANENSKAKTEFLAVMSHEVRTPLNGIIGLSELLKTHPFDQNITNIVNMLNDSSQDLLQLLNEILDFSKLDANKLEIEVRQFELNHFMKSVVESHIATAARNELDLKLELSTEEQSFYLGDTLRLRQVLNNLISNAIKFSTDGQIRIKIDSEIVGSEVMLGFNIIDNGIGIEKNKLKDLFSPFTQADNSITRQYGGTGLGLAICKQLVELMHGTFGVNSEVNKGSHFWFKVPLSKVSVLPQNQPESSPIANTDIKFTAKILVAEDNPVNQLVIKNLLDTFGHHCDVVNNGQEAVDKAITEHYDIIFMDYHMPKMDGIAATQRIREQNNAINNKNTPIIALTADIQPQVNKKFRRAGANGSLLKPFTRNNLADQLSKWLQISEHNSSVETIQKKYDKSILAPEILEEINALSDPDDNDIVIQLSKLYQETCPDLIKQLQTGFEGKDSDVIFKAAHALKSSSANIGAISMTKAAAEIENLSRDGEIDKTRDLVFEMDQLYQNTKLALDEKIAEYS